MQLMKLLRELLAEEPRTVIAVTHDVYEALFLARRIVVLGGRPVSVRLDRENPGAGNERTEESIPLEGEISRALAPEGPEIKQYRS
jgi:ABC-type nitrate/sulfonate/bicarbonate transport system ATPase subunit